jgi:hypothetical protein
MHEISSIQLSIVFDGTTLSNIDPSNLAGKLFLFGVFVLAIGMMASIYIYISILNSILLLKCTLEETTVTIFIYIYMVVLGVQSSSNETHAFRNSMCRRPSIYLSIDRSPYLYIYIYIYIYIYSHLVFLSTLSIAIVVVLVPSRHSHCLKSLGRYVLNVFLRQLSLDLHSQTHALVDFEVGGARYPQRRPLFARRDSAP